jgi:hypothetical protein
MTVQLDETNHVIWPDDLTPDETNQINAVAAMPDQTGRTLPKAAAAIGGAFLVYQAYMKHRLSKQLKGAEDLPPQQYAAVIQQTFNTFMPAWTYMVTPAIFSSYLSGVEMAEQSIASQQLRDLALRYSWGLGEYLNNRSIDAAIRGYQAQLNRNINGKIALANIIDAFAVPVPGVRSLVTLWTGRAEAKVSEAALPSVKKARINRQIVAQLHQRAELIGDQESFSAQSTGKQLAWSYAQQIGLIPENATRVWETADDERVCPECGPLNGMEMPVNQPFEINKKKFWSPPLHVNCRCNARLKSHLASELGQQLYHQLQDANVTKADWDAREHPRDTSTGQFSRAHHGSLQRLRQMDRPTVFAEPEPDISTLANEALLREATVAPEKPKLNLNIFDTPQTGEGKPNLNVAALDLAIDVPKGPELAVGPTLDIAPDLALGMDLDIGPTLGGKRPNMHLKPITSITPPETRKRKQQHSYSPLPQPVYAIYNEDSPSFGPWGRPDVGDAMEVTNVHFTSDPYKVQRWAEDYRREKLADAKDVFREWSDVPGAISLPAQQYGRDANYILSDHDIDNAVAWYERAEARVENGDDYDEVPDDFAQVRIYDPSEPTTRTTSRWGFPVEHHGGLGTDEITYRQIVELLHLDEVVAAMEPRLVRVEDARDDADVHYDSDADSTEALLRDDYRIEMKWREISLAGQKFLTMYLAPMPDSKQMDVED